MWRGASSCDAFGASARPLRQARRAARATAPDRRALDPTRSGPARAAATPHLTARTTTPAARPGPLHPTRHATVAGDSSAMPPGVPATPTTRGRGPIHHAPAEDGARGPPGPLTRVPRVSDQDRAATRTRRAAEVRESQPTRRRPRRPGGDPAGTAALRPARAGPMVLNPPALPRKRRCPARRLVREGRTSYRIVKEADRNCEVGQPTPPMTLLGRWQSLPAGWT